MAGEPVAGDAAGSHCGLANLGCGVVHALLSSGATCGATLDERERSGALENGLRPLPSHHSHPQRKPRLRRGTLNKRVPHRLADRSRPDGVVMDVGEVPEDSKLLGWVRTSFGADARPLDGLTCRNDDFDSLLLCDRPGQEPGEFSAEHFSAQRYIIDSEGELTFGNAPVERAPEEQLGLRLSSGEMVWTARVNGRRLVPPEPHVPVASAQAPANRTATAGSQQLSEQARIEEKRQRRLQKHPQLRQHMAWLVAQHCNGSQAALARKLQLRAASLSEYNTGMARSQRLSQMQLDAYHTRISAAIERAELPLQPPSAEPSRVSPTTVPNTNAPPPTEHKNPKVRAPSAAPAASTAPVAVLTLNLSEVASVHQGGQLLILDLGQEQAEPSDSRWEINAGGETLRLRPGLRARYTFGARSSTLGGRTFEWWVETLSSV